MATTLSYKYMELTSIISSTGIITLRKGKIDVGRLTIGMKKIVRWQVFGFGIKGGSSLRLLSLLSFYMDGGLGLQLIQRIVGGDSTNHKTMYSLPPQY